MHRTPSKVVIFWNLSVAGLDLLACGLAPSVVELVIYIYLLICKPRPTGCRQTYRQTNRRIINSNW